MKVPRQRRDHCDPPESAHRSTTENNLPTTEDLWFEGPSQLISVVAHQLGYRPAPNSLVCVGRRLAEIVMISASEIPATADLSRPDHVSITWATFGPPLRTGGADSVIVIAYAGAERTAEILTFAAAAPLPVFDVLRVDGGRYWTLACAHRKCSSPGCCREGTELGDHPELVARLILDGASSPTTRRDLARPLQPGPAALIESVALVLTHNVLPDPELSEAALNRAHDARVEKPVPLPPWEAALLLQALANPAVRDACLIWSDDAAWWLWCDLIRNAPPGWVAPVATLIAITAYQRSDGVMAGIALEIALADRPDYTLANDVREYLSVAISPAEFRRAITMADTLRLRARELDCEIDQHGSCGRDDDPIT